MATAILKLFAFLFISTATYSGAYAQNHDIESVKDHQVILSFPASKYNLSENHKATLSKKIIPFLEKHEDAHIEIRAYASSDSRTRESPARRLSLHRALAIENFLRRNNIAERRIHLRPLGPSGQSESDYVEMKILRF